MAIQIVQGQNTLIDPQVTYADSGWSVSGGYANHLACFAGTIVSISNYPFIDGTSYDISYLVSNYQSGTINSLLGSNAGVSNNTNGTFTDTITYHTGDVLKFYSDGALSVSAIQIAEHLDSPIQNASTFAFHEPSNRWVEGYDFVPELMTRFGDSFFTFLNGQMWEHETNPVAGSFYGTKYPSTITFIINSEYDRDKIFYNIRLDAKGNWSAPTLQTPDNNQFPFGMLSRLKTNNFKLIDGKLYAAFLGDINDPNFASINPVNERQLQALFRGRKLQGGWLVITMYCNDDAPCEMSSVEVYYTDVFRSIE